MAVEVDELYSNLNKLLDDICKFLTDGTNYEKLSPYARKQADELISRSKKQLQEIAKVAVNNEYDGAYVDMERKSVEEAPVITPPPVAEPQPNPYANLPAKDLSQDLKYGPLCWKYRIILKFDKNKRVYAGLHDNWFLIYSSEKDLKPIQTFDLRFHKAQSIICKQNKTPTQDFELVNTTAEGKSYYFVARTHKDMLQWVSHINRCYENLSKLTNVIPSDDDISETYDMITDLTNQGDQDEEEEEIYHDIETYNPEIVKTINKPPDLPARRCINIPLPPVPQKESFDDDSSESSTYDLVVTTSRPSLGSKSSFSEEEEDDIYEPFVSKPVEPKPPVQKSEENQQKPNQSYIHKVYNSTTAEKPKTPAKPKFLPEKPRSNASFKK
ncbi:hypothetical protein Zmor_002871 [Zophobas morio]|uniref:PH domain-containing protein n=1 Tax=Zophobas morio TaxID=2755281 RepID=A0AA38HLQ4_9CUCU|nr:hypothetical protein Zmor_002871 [Zophobas morio]